MEETGQMPVAVEVTDMPVSLEKAVDSGKRGIRGLLEGKRNRNKRLREEYKKATQQAMTGYAVAEETTYRGDGEEKENRNSYGQTVYIEETVETEGRPHRLLTSEGRLLASLEKTVVSIGKKKGEVDLVLEDASVSRIHARITREEGRAYLEDLNSTNGTFRNGQRMQPYEKKKLEEGDEIRIGKSVFIFR